MRHVTLFISSEPRRGCDGNVTAMSPSDSQVHMGKSVKKNLHIVSQRFFSGSAVYPTSSN